MPRHRAAGDPFARIAPYYDQLMANVPYDLWADYLFQLAELAGRPMLPGSRVLDLATGTGSVAFELAKRGCLVVGVDRSCAMLDQARRRARDAGLAVEFLCYDLADLSLPAEFSHAVCLYDSLNYITEADRLKQAFANTRAALVPGGLFIFDVNTVRALEEELFTQTSRQGAPIQYRWTSRYDPATRVSRIRMRFTIPAARQRFSIVHEQRAYTDEEIRSLLRQAGFRRISAYEAYRLTSPTPDSDRVFYVAERADAPDQS